MENRKTKTVALLPLRGLCVFPGMHFHFDIGREKSIKAVEKALESNEELFLVAQRNVEKEDPTIEDLYTIGTFVKIKQMVKLPSDNIRILIESSHRGKLLEILQDKPYLSASVELMEVEPHIIRTPKDEAYVRAISDHFYDYSEMSGIASAKNNLSKILYADDLNYLCDFVCQNVSFDVHKKQAALEELNPQKRGDIVLKCLAEEIEIIKLENKLQDRVRNNIEKSQKEHYLREQIRSIQEELGEGDSPEDEYDEYKKKILALKLDTVNEEKLLKEAGRLRRMYPTAQEASIIRTYLDTCLALPWNKQCKENKDMQKAKDILNKDHYGLEKVKERIMEIFAVRTLKDSTKGQVICLSGPPGVGKTSIAKSIAKALGRPYARLSLGGVRDEADIRGHRRTYLGSMPGRFIAALQEAGANNCVILIDEIDKLGHDYKGDPDSALLEVFDMEQNNTFHDHYVDMPVDLSNVIFIATANEPDAISRPLLDRMEHIEIGSYTDIEKLEIAKRHLLAKQRQANGLQTKQLKITDEAMLALINNYTKESGVRELERSLAQICRKAGVQLVEQSKKSVTITESNLKVFMGSPKYKLDLENMNLAQCGVVNGLAYTSVGGELLTIEANVTKGSGKQEITGNLGDVMKESVKAAVTYIRSRAELLGIAEDFYEKKDIHVHFPEGATPKNGPSAGIGIATAVISALTGIPVAKTYAMTGEITIRGRVLPIGGLREKTMAAYKNGVKTVIVPEDNRSDIEELDPKIKAGLEFVFVREMDAVVQLLFTKKQQKSDKIVEVTLINQDVKGAEAALRQ